jgi:hypothetical protein
LSGVYRLTIKEKERIMNARRMTWLVLAAIVLTACAPKATEAGSGGWIDWNGEDGWSGASGEGMAAGEADGMPLAEAPGEAYRSDAGEESGAADQGASLRAGSVDDNAEWDDYLLYRLQAADWGLRVHDIDVTQRYIVHVITPSGRPVLGAEVTFENSQGDEVVTLMTPADGRALFFPAAFGAEDDGPFTAVVRKGGSRASGQISADQREVEIVLETSSTVEPVRLDIHFLIDVTGSMGDEIQRLKDNMIAIAEQISELPSSPDVRFGMTVYRDRGDAFVSRTFDFTPDVEAFVDALREVEANGGGDYPESLNEGLHNALHLPEWRVDDTVSIIFLVADAPPQLIYDQDYDYAVEVLVAAERGIKIFPIASSGLDDQGEYIFRQLAQITGGKFLFLTYGAGGAPGDDTTHHVDDYSVMSLDELVLAMVKEELAHLEAQP